jgi:hypothetical protein
MRQISDMSGSADCKSSSCAWGGNAARATTKTRMRSFAWYVQSALFASLGAWVGGVRRA